MKRKRRVYFNYYEEHWDFVAASIGWNLLRWYALIAIALFAVGFTPYLAFAIHDANRPVQSIAAEAVESSRPLDDGDKAPADWTGDGVADGWMYGEWLPGQSGTVYFLDGESVSAPAGMASYVVLGVLVALVVFIFVIALALFLDEHLRNHARSAAGEDWDAVELNAPLPTRYLSRIMFPRRLSRAASRRTNYVLLAAYLWHPLSSVARAAAGNPATPRWALHLARNRAQLLDITLASPDTPWQVLAAHASGHPLPTSLLRLIASNTNASPQTLAHIASQEAAPPEILEDVLANPACPPALAHTIALSAAGTGPDHSPEICRVYASAASRQELSADTLTWIAHNCTDPRVLDLVARHPRTLPEDAVLAGLLARTATR